MTGKLCSMLGSLLLAIILFACDDNNELTTPDIKIVSGTVQLTSAGEHKLLIAEGSDALTVTSHADWCKVSAEGEGTCRYYVTVEANTEEKVRETFVSIVYGNLGKGRVTITQEAYVKPQEPVNPGTMESDAQTLAKKIVAGINIGNTLEVPKGHDWGNNGQITEAYIQGLKNLGFNAVRIPCAWSSYADQQTHVIEKTWMDKVAEAVNLCVENDMYVLLNIHWDGGWLEDNILGGYSEAINTKQKVLWTQIATRFKDVDEHLLFAGCNEVGMNETSGGTPFNETSMATIKKYEQTFVDAVRATGGNNATRNLVVQAPATRISDAVGNLYALPEDVVENRLLVEVHFYDPYQFCLMEEDANWGKVWWYWGADNHVEGSDRNTRSQYEEDYVKDQFQQMQEKYSSQGVPVILGEYSTMKRTNAENQEMHQQSRAYWNEVVTREAKNHGIVPFYWETNGDIDRTDGTAKEPAAIEGIIKGAQAGTYPF